MVFSFPNAELLAAFKALSGIMVYPRVLYFYRFQYSNIPFVALLLRVESIMARIQLAGATGSFFMEGYNFNGQINKALIRRKPSAHIQPLGLLLN
jgi:hypothetical protein